jgi:hypothetical protein
MRLKQTRPRWLPHRLTSAIVASCGKALTGPSGSTVRNATLRSPAAPDRADTRGSPPCAHSNAYRLPSRRSWLSAQSDCNLHRPGNGGSGCRAADHVRPRPRSPFISGIRVLLHEGRRAHKWRRSASIRCDRPAGPEGASTQSPPCPAKSERPRLSEPPSYPDRAGIRH